MCVIRNKILFQSKTKLIIFFFFHCYLIVHVIVIVSNMSNETTSHKKKTINKYTSINNYLKFFPAIIRIFNQGDLYLIIYCTSFVGTWLRCAGPLIVWYLSPNCKGVAQYSEENYSQQKFNTVAFYLSNLTTEKNKLINNLLVRHCIIRELIKRSYKTTRADPRCLSGNNVL